MTLLANVLQGDRTDLDLIQLALETLANIVTYEVGNDEGTFSFLIKAFADIYFSYRTREFTAGYYRSIHRYESLFIKQRVKINFLSELYIKNKGHVHAALELIEVSFIIH